MKHFLPINRVRLLPAVLIGGSVLALTFAVVGVAVVVAASTRQEVPTMVHAIENLRVAPVQPIAMTPKAAPASKEPAKTNSKPVMWDWVSQEEPRSSKPERVTPKTEIVQKPVDAAPDVEKYGTAVDFVATPMIAFREAARQRKMVFVLHISGNFEEQCFTWNNAEALRVGALTSKEVGHYLNKYFVCSFQKVGTFTVTANGQKQGGNVASYFCLPDSRVIHAIPGPVNAKALIKEARWAVETREKVLLDAKDNPLEYKELFAKAHQERSQVAANLVNHGWGKGRVTLNTKSPAELGASLKMVVGNNQDKAHLLLSVFPNAKLKDIYEVVFQDILGEKVSTAPVIGS